MNRSTDPEPQGSTSRPHLVHPNPLELAWQRGVAEGRDPEARDECLSRYAFAIPNEAALAAIRDASPSGVVEIGAGTGYWARLLHERGVGVVAFDTAPASSPHNPWFSASVAWFAVASGDETAVDDHGDRTLLLVWPTRNEEWAAEAVQRYAAAGGTTLSFVGERIGGRTGDDRFHALIGDVDRCWSCAYGVITTACLCGIVPLFRHVQTVEIPRWNGFDDDLRLYERELHAAAVAATPQRGAQRGRLEALRTRWPSTNVVGRRPRPTQPR